MRLRLTATGPASRRPVRLRLTLVYSGLFLLAGAILLAITYALVASTLTVKGQPADPGAGPSASTVMVKPVASQPADPTAASRLVNAKPSPPSSDPGQDLAELCKSGQIPPEQVVKCKALAQEAYNSGADAARLNALHYLLYISLGGLTLSALLSAFLGWIVAGRALRPVHAITAAARRASDANLGERIALSGPPDELKDLADTFDAMLARLDAAFASQRRFVANASHELRTPLTVMRTAIDVTLAKPERTPAQLEDMAVEVRQAAERAEALIEALLALARSDRGTGTRSRLDLAVLAEDALDSAATAIGAASLQVASSLEPARTTGDPVLAERLVGNLIDNAVRHNATGGWVTVSTGNRDGMAFIHVTNSGPVIDAAEVESLFEPFHRRPPANQAQPEGVGLGLSIVRSVVAAHLGQVTARPLESGGLEVTAWLPNA
jgi:signal transduction histidine kinase